MQHNHVSVHGTFDPELEVAYSACFAIKDPIVGLIRIALSPTILSGTIFLQFARVPQSFR